LVRDRGSVMRRAVDLFAIDRQKVKDSPPYDPAVTVDGTYDEILLTYYSGIKWVEGR
jgi:hypothetical protein